jgi:hypothetical protein
MSAIGRLQPEAFARRPCALRRAVCPRADRRFPASLGRSGCCWKGPQRVKFSVAALAGPIRATCSQERSAPPSVVRQPVAAWGGSRPVRLCLAHSMPAAHFERTTNTYRATTTTTGQRHRTRNAPRPTKRESRLPPLPRSGETSSLCWQVRRPAAQPGNRPGSPWPSIAGMARQCAPRSAMQSRGAPAWPVAPCRRGRSPACPGRGSSRLRHCAGMTARPYASIRWRFVRRAGSCGEEHPIHREACRATARCHSAPLNCGAVRLTRKQARNLEPQMHADAR